jgi:hypothetical protein
MCRTGQRANSPEPVIAACEIEGENQQMAPAEEALRGDRATRAPALPRALLPLIIVLAVLELIEVLAAEPARIVRLEVPVVAPAVGAEFVVGCGLPRTGVPVRDTETARVPTHRQAALRLVMQHHDELCAIVTLPVQRLVGDDERGSRQYGRRDAIEYILRNGDAVERLLGGLPRCRWWPRSSADHRRYAQPP